jgi:hypothetical protein
MPRPRISADKKRQPLCISIPADVKREAMASGNASQFFEDSASFFLEAQKLLRKGKSRDALLESLEDLIDVMIAARRRSEPTRAFDAFLGSLPAKPIKKGKPQ